jgi:Zn-dependent protease with chaperone function
VLLHEFSHILNGDMRINIRLMSPVWHTLLAIAGRRILMYSRFGRSRIKVIAIF